MLKWLDSTEVEGRLGTPTRLRVEEELCRLEWVASVDARQITPIVTAFLAVTSNTPEHFQARMIEGEVEANLRGVGGHVEDWFWTTNCSNDFGQIVSF